MNGFKTLDGFKKGASFQVQYPRRGNTNILWERRNGRILKTGHGRDGNRPWVMVQYWCHKTGLSRVAILSIAKMVNPVVGS